MSKIPEGLGYRVTPDMMYPNGTAIPEGWEFVRFSTDYTYADGERVLRSSDLQIDSSKPLLYLPHIIVKKTRPQRKPRLFLMLENFHPVTRSTTTSWTEMNPIYEGVAVVHANLVSEFTPVTRKLLHAAMFPDHSGLHMHKDAIMQILYRLGVPTEAEG